MLSISHSLLLGVIAVVMTGCFGYAPLYSLQGEQLNQVQVGEVTMREITRNVGSRRVAQLVAQQLEQTFSGAGDYVLTVSIEETTRALAVRRDAVEQRLELNLSSVITLEKEGNSVLRTSAGAASSYNVEDSPFGTDAGRDRARQAAAERLSEEIVEKITVFLHQEQGQ